MIKDLRDTDVLLNKEQVGTVEPTNWTETDIEELKTRIATLEKLIAPLRNSPECYHCKGTNTYPIYEVMCEDCCQVCRFESSTGEKAEEKCHCERSGRRSPSSRK